MTIAAARSLQQRRGMAIQAVLLKILDGFQSADMPRSPKRTRRTKRSSTAGSRTGSDRKRERPGWPDARGWISIASFVLTIMVLWMLVAFSDLRADAFFKSIAALIIGTGWINGPQSWAFSATKSGGDRAANNTAIIKKQAEASPPIAEEPKP